MGSIIVTIVGMMKYETHRGNLTKACWRPLRHFAASQWLTAYPAGSAAPAMNGTRSRRSRDLSVTVRAGVGWLTAIDGSPAGGLCHRQNKRRDWTLPLRPAGRFYRGHKLTGDVIVCLLRLLKRRDRELPTKFVWPGKEFTRLSLSH